MYKYSWYDYIGFLIAIGLLGWWIGALQSRVNALEHTVKVMMIVESAR